ncbi:helix-turn-helix domain-containing protein [Microbacterium aurugineum]
MFGIRDLPADWFTKPISYGAAHDRVRRVHGRADMHVCVDCGHRAQHWSYNGDSEFEQSGEIHYSHGAKTFLRWSTDTDAYSPRCRFCHAAKDYGFTRAPWTPADLDALAALKGMTVAQQAARLGVSPSTIDRMRRALRERG